MSKKNGLENVVSSLLKQYLLVGVGFGGLFLFIEVYSFFHAQDLEEDYVKVAAVIQTVESECTIQSHGYLSKQKIVDKETNKLLYMDCDFAPHIAKEHDLSNEDISIHIDLTYQYLSPVDQKYYTGKYASLWSYKNVKPGLMDQVFPGKSIVVFAHKEEAATSELPLRIGNFDDKDLGF